MLFFEGDSSTAFYIVVSGSVKITKLAESGREKILKVMKSGDFFGEMGLLEDKPRSATAVIREKTRLIIFNKDDFLRFIKNQSQIALNIITELSRRLRKADQDIESLAFLDVESRLKGYFVKMAQKKTNKKKKKIKLNRKLTHKQLAHRIGTSRETITRIMKRLENRGLIEVTEKNINLIEIEKWD